MSSEAISKTAPLAFDKPGANRREGMLVSGLFGGIGGLVLCALVIRNVLDTPAGPMDVPILAGFAGLGALFGACCYDWNRWYRVALGPDCIELFRPGRRVVVDPRNVLALMGVGGVNLTGGEMVLCKRVLVVTRRGVLKIDFKEQSDGLYELLLELCPGAVGIPFRGPFRYPQPADPDLRRTIHDAVPVIRRHLWRQVWLALFSAVVFVLVGCLFLAMAYLGMRSAAPGSEGDVGRVGVFGIVLLVATVLSIVHAGRVFWRNARASRMVWRRARQPPSGQ